MKLTEAQKRSMVERCGQGRAKASSKLWRELENQYAGFLSMRSEIANYGCTIGRIGTSFQRGL